MFHKHDCSIYSRFCIKTRDSGEPSTRARAALIADIAFIIPISIALLMSAK